MLLSGLRGCGLLSPLSPLIQVQALKQIRYGIVNMLYSASYWYFCMIVKVSRLAFDNMALIIHRVKPKNNWFHCRIHRNHCLMLRSLFKKQSRPWPTLTGMIFSNTRAMLYLTRYTSNIYGESYVYLSKLTYMLTVLCHPATRFHSTLEWASWWSSLTRFATISLPLAIQCSLLVCDGSAYHYITYFCIQCSNK